MDLVGLDGLGEGVHDELSGHVEREEGRGEALDGLDVGARVDGERTRRHVSGMDGDRLRVAHLTTMGSEGTDGQGVDEVQVDGWKR